MVYFQIYRARTQLGSLCDIQHSSYCTADLFILQMLSPFQTIRLWYMLSIVLDFVTVTSALHRATDSKMADKYSTGCVCLCECLLVAAAAVLVLVHGYIDTVKAF